MMRACDQFDFRYDFIEISRTVSPPLKLRTCGGDIVSPSIYCYCGLTPIHSKNLPIHSAVIGTLRVFELSGKLSRCSEDSFRASKKSTPRCLMKNVNDSSLPERWQSGRMRRIANPVSRFFAAPRVRISLSPLSLKSYLNADYGDRFLESFPRTHCGPLSESRVEDSTAGSYSVVQWL